MKTAGKKRALAVLLACVMLLGLAPVMAAEETVQVTFSIDTRAITDDPLGVLGEEPILDGVKTLNVVAGTSALEVLRMAAKEFEFAFDAENSGWVNSIGWVDDDIYAWKDPVSGYGGGWSFWLDGRPAEVGLGSVILNADSALTCRYSVTGVKMQEPWDYYYDLALLDARARLQAVLEQADALAEADKTQEIAALAEQGQKAIDDLDTAMADYEGADYFYFQDCMLTGADDTLEPATTSMQDIAYKLEKLVAGEVAVTGVTLNAKSIDTLKTGQSYQITAAVEPENATNKAVVFSTDDPELATIDDYGKLTAHQSGVAIVRAESAENPAASATCVVMISDRETPDVSDTIAKTADWIAKQRGNFSGTYETAMDWDMFALARSGHLPGQAAQANYLASLAAFIDGGGLTYPSDIARAILTLGALGIEPTDFAGHDLVAELAAAPLEKQGINAYVYALLALDSGGYHPKNAKYSREEMVAAIADLQQPDGYFWIQKDWGVDNDLTAMVVCALAPYAVSEPAKTVIDSAMAWLSSQQTGEAGFESWGSENSQTPAQVMAALATLERDPVADTAFVKDGKTLYYNICGFLNDDGSFGYSPELISSNAMATQQVLYCLAALERYQRDAAPLYDFSDVDTACDSEWLTALAECIAEAEAAEEAGYTKTSYDTLTKAVAQAKAVTADDEKSTWVNAYLAMQAALSGLKTTIPITDGKVTVDADSTGAIEPLEDTEPLEITVQPDAASAYLELGQVADSLPEISIVFDGMTVAAAEGAALESGATAVALPRELEYADQAVIDELNLLLSSGSVRSIERRVALGGDVPTVLDGYWTLTFANLGTSSAAYAQNGKITLIPTVSNDAAGEKEEYPIYAYRNGTDLVIKSRQTAEFMIFSVKKDSGSGGGSGSDTPVVHVTVDPTAVEGMKAKTKEITYRDGDTAYSVLERMMGKSAIQTDRAGDYVQGIEIDGEMLKEFDYGPESGWMYSVNGKFIQRPSTEVSVDEGDDVVWIYKTEMDEEFDEEEKDDNQNGGGSSRPSGGSSSSSGGTQVQVTDPADTTDQEQQSPAFTDLADTSDWARDAVTEAAKRGLMEGYDNRFDPQRPLTRAEWTAVLVRLFDLQASEASVSFADVPADAWYVESLAAACEAGIVTGRSATQFAPNDSITREELCVMLSRVMQIEENTALDFVDTADISPWAADSVSQMVAAGIMQGRGAAFDPHGAVTREMAAVVCLRVADM